MPVTYRYKNFGALVRAMDPDWNKPHNAYEFSNGRTFIDQGYSTTLNPTPGTIISDGGTIISDGGTIIVDK